MVSSPNVTSSPASRWSPSGGGGGKANTRPGAAGAPSAAFLRVERLGFLAECASGSMTSRRWLSERYAPGEARPCAACGVDRPSAKSAVASTHARCGVARGCTAARRADMKYAPPLAPGVVGVPGPPSRPSAVASEQPAPRSRASSCLPRRSKLATPRSTCPRPSMPWTPTPYGCVTDGCCSGAGCCIPAYCMPPMAPMPPRPPRPPSGAGCGAP
mmetsp:Transcript_23338/g.78807  ORF Transcript_23338/g.78807 Transcript_23338/m.78807 type:complete len:215 (+) Transcript_23338:1017-1661(+)